MVAISTVTNSTAAYGQAAFSTGKQLGRAFQGDTTLVSFVRNNQTLVQFDCCMNEGHGVETTPTAFPVEDGSVVGDHIIVSPTNLSLVGVVTDSPINNKARLLQEAVTSTFNTVAGPLGVLASTAAFALASASPTSRSVGVFNTMLKLAAGDPDAKIPTPPIPFDVVTNLRRYPNMVIKSLQVPRDATTGKALVFTLLLTQMTVVAPQDVVLSLSKIPEIASIKSRLEEDGGNEIVESYKRGVNRLDVAVGAAQRFPAP